MEIYEFMAKHNITFKWCPGHCKIEGNEKADEFAKNAAKGGIINPKSILIIAGFKSIAKARVKRMVQNWWDGICVLLGYKAAGAYY